METSPHARPCSRDCLSGATGIAVFDLDRTMVPGSSLALFGRVLVQRGLVSRWSVARELASETLFAKGALGAASLDRLSHRLLATAAGREWQPLAEAADAAGAMVVEAIFPAALWLLRRHQDMGDATVLLSASPHELVCAVAAALSMDVAIGTRIEVVDGRLTGRLDGPLCHGHGKLARLRDVAGDIDFDLVTAYADSTSDRPVLEAARHAVVVNPERGMTALANASSWPILRFS